jgi:hypothetical protein
VSRLKIVEGGAKPKEYRKKSENDIDLLVCPECDSRASYDVTLGRHIRNGKPVGGNKQTRCANCDHVLWDW